MAYDAQSAYDEASASWPLPRVLSHYGLGQFADQTRAQLRTVPCPFCGKKGKFSTYIGKSGKLRCRCWSASCRANPTMDEVAFIQLRENLGEGRDGRQAAFKKFLELAGVQIERQRPKPPQPSAPPPEEPPQESPHEPQETREPEPEEPEEPPVDPSEPQHEHDIHGGEEPPPSIEREPEPDNVVPFSKTAKPSDTPRPGRATSGLRSTPSLLSPSQIAPD